MWQWHMYWFLDSLSFHGIKGLQECPLDAKSGLVFGWFLPLFASKLTSGTLAALTYWPSYACQR